MYPASSERPARDFPSNGSRQRLTCAEHAPGAHCPASEKRQQLFGLSVDFDSYEGALSWMSNLLGASADESVAVGFLNAHNLNVACADPEYRWALNQFDRVFPDGVGLHVASKSAGISDFENLAGTYLIPSFLKIESLRGRRVFLLGDAPDQIEAVKESFCRIFPHLKVAGFHHGYFDLDDSESVVRGINASDAEILLVGMGTPRQEKWLAQHARKLRPKLRIGVGGLFKYWNGRLRRAPALVRRMKLEWAFIAFQQPCRWRRYACDAPVLLWRLLAHALTTRAIRT